MTVVTPTQDLGHTMSAVKRLGAMAGPMTFQPMDDLMGLTGKATNSFIGYF